MKAHLFLFLLLWCVFSTSFAETPPVPASLDSERVVRVYELLKDAEAMTTSGVLSSHDDLTKEARSMSLTGLKKACLDSVDHITAAASSSPTNRRPDIFGYVKNAWLRLSYNREEDHGGHTAYAVNNRAKASAETREHERAIKEALTKSDLK